MEAKWQSGVIDIGEIALKYQDYALQAKGRITPNGDWPVALQLSAQLPMPDAEDLNVQAQLSGSLHALILDATTQGYLVAQLQGQLQPLDANLPAQLSIKVPSFKAVADLPASLTLADVLLQLNGDLQQGYQIAGLAQLPNTPEQMRLTIAALLKASGAELRALRLSAGEEAFVALTGAVSWQRDIEAEAQVQWQDFPWYSLLEQEDIPVQLQTLAGQVSYKAGDYQGQLNGDLTGPAGAFTVTTAFDGNLQQVQLSTVLTGWRMSLLANLIRRIGWRNYLVSWPARFIAKVFCAINSCKSMPRLI